MGIRRQTSRIPVLLAMALRASRGDAQVPEGRSSQVIHAGVAHSLVSVARPDLTLSNQLSPAECSVARMLLEGRSHAEIAELRRTSVRTIANQLAATFQKLGVSGRSQLLCYVLRTPEAVSYAS
jgi:DNA-binding NarL/FixJ family response regulator